jgi:predicted ATPase/class 3 adenylate cyclase
MSAQSEPSATSRTYTFLFTDLEGSTRLWEQYPEAMKGALDRHDALLLSAVESSNGQLVKTTGDGLMAVFTSGLDGVNACLEAQRSLLDEPWGETGPLKVRMGMHVGEAQPRAGDYYGTAVNRAARLMSTAHGGQVVCSAALAGLLRDLLPPEVTLRDLGEHRLKDLEGAQHVFQLQHPSLASDFPPIRSLNRQPNNLPTQPTALVGRVAELADIEERLNDDVIRLLTLTGPGGTGKTRLALQSAADLIDRFPEGAYFIDLAPIREPESVLAVIARTLGLSETGDRPPLEELKRQLKDQRKLLVLDNFEQVTAAAPLIADLLQHCPKLKLLVTSREALRVRGEHIYPVPPLALPKAGHRTESIELLAQYAAVQLFVERAQAVRPDFKLTTENAEPVTEICIRLDGLPLAIELAAARIRLFPPSKLLERLESRLKMLRGGARDLPERQQTLRGTIEWSYELLEAGEQRLFELLSVFSGSTFEAVEVVAEDVELPEETVLDVFEALASLVDKSLVRQSEVAGDEPRLRMLETIREYATDRLAQNADLSAATHQAHAAYYADFAQNRWEPLTGTGRDDALLEMVSDFENLQIAWRYWANKSELEQLNKMVDSLWQLYDARGWYLATVELTTDLLNVLSSTPSTPERVQQEIMLQTSLARALMAIRGYTPEVEQAYSRALELSEGAGEVPQLFPVLRGLASYYMYRSEFDKGAEIGEKFLQLAESRDDDNIRVAGYLVLGSNVGFAEGLNAGLAYLDKGIALFDPGRPSSRRFRLGNEPGVVCYTTSAFFLMILGFPDSGLKRANEALEIARQLNHPFTMAYTLFHTGVLHMQRRELDVAQARAQAMLEIAEEHDFQIWDALANILHGTCLVGMGQPEEGLAQVDRGMALYQDHITPPVFWPSLVSVQSMAYAMAGRPDVGLRLLEEAMESAGVSRDDSTLPQLFLLRGDLLLAASPANAAEARSLYRQILEAARQQEALMLELQSATRLCRMALLQGEAEEAGRLLGEAYDKFTEGFDTADLLEAKALLEELDNQAPI